VGSPDAIRALRGFACLLLLKLVGLYEAKFDALCLTPLRERIAMISSEPLPQ
jgi:hypothetical protein